MGIVTSKTAWIRFVILIVGNNVLLFYCCAVIHEPINVTLATSKRDVGQTVVDGDQTVINRDKAT